MDPKAAMDEWVAAKKGLTLAETELKAAQAGHEVAMRCEREAWEKIAKMCGRESLPSAPPQAAPAVHIAAPSSLVTTMQPLVSTGRLVQQDTPSSWAPIHSGTSWCFDTRAR